MVIALPIVLYSFAARFSVEPIPEDYDERSAFQAAAMAMISDHPFGVGANNFVVTANTQGYYDRAGVAPVFSSRSAHVHNAYLLAAAETGYLGAIAFCVMLLAPLVKAFRVGWRDKTELGALLLGSGMALLMLYIQSFFEWAFYLWWFQYLFAISIGLIAGVSQRLSRSTSARRSTTPVSYSSSPRAGSAIHCRSKIRQTVAVR
jgi:O-antigen ligase